ncbi:MAG: 1-acyl-sn-glycerol-3-phosphate acyltransferase [Bacteriovoracaceae bacterium]|jgi:1-acyl-sn-glycerol-3-phosphate acyltransferase
MVILIAYQGVSLWGLDAAMLVPAAGGIFILPFFLFSATAGQIADKYEKATVIKVTKITEFLIMCVASLGFYLENFQMLFFVLFCMGTQSAFFGPLKYGIIPALVKDKELVLANAFVSTGTFIAILVGTIMGGSIPLENFVFPIAIGLTFFSGLGILTSQFINKVGVIYPEIKVDYTFFRPTWEILKITARDTKIFKTVLGISWFWFMGAAILSILPTLSKDVLGGDKTVATLFLALFTIGMGVGSFIVAKISDKKVEIGVVPTAGVLMGIFLIDLYFMPKGYIKPDELVGLSEFFTQPAAFRAVFDLFMISVFGGMYTVPQMTYVQEISDPGVLARTIAGNNIWNALFMVTASVVVMLLVPKGIPFVCLVLGILHILVSYIVYWFYSEHAVRFWMKIFTKLFYKVEVVGEENVPKGTFILACNHISFVDWVILMGTFKEPIRFVIDYNFYYLPTGPFWFSQAKLVPIATKKEDPEVLKKAFDKIGDHLREGATLGIFPEGWISRDGKMRKFQPGILKVLKDNPVPVVLVSLDGLWGSIFSYSGGKVVFKMPNIFKRRAIKVTIHPPIKPEDYTSKMAEKIMISGVSDYKNNGQLKAPSDKE